MSDETKLVWLPEELAKKIEAIKDPTSEEMLKLINGYIDKTRKNYKENLELLDEDVLMFRGLLVGVKKQYVEALNTQLDSEYELWESIDKQRPRLSEKIKTLTDDLKPLVSALETITGLLAKIRTWEIKELVENVVYLSSHLQGETGEMIRFICTEYKPKQRAAANEK